VRVVGGWFGGRRAREREAARSLFSPPSSSHPRAPRRRVHPLNPLPGPCPRLTSPPRKGREMEAKGAALRGGPRHTGIRAPFLSSPRAAVPVSGHSAGRVLAALAPTSVTCMCAGHTLARPDAAAVIVNSRTGAGAGAPSAPAAAAAACAAAANGQPPPPRPTSGTIAPSPKWKSRYVATKAAPVPGSPATGGRVAAEDAGRAGSAAMRRAYSTPSLAATACRKGQARTAWSRAVAVQAGGGEVARVIIWRAAHTRTHTHTSASNRKSDGQA
jgi:hypothetical protein